MDKQDTFSRDGIRGEERIALGLSILTADQRFQHASTNWNRGRTTMWESMYMLVDNINRYLKPIVLQFPRGARAT